MKDSLKTGLSFGLTSGVITTLGLIVGLHSGTRSRAVVVGGILTIAIADAFSDALGIHVSEESENAHTPLEIWVSTLATLLAKFVFAMTFLIPVLLLPLDTAIVAGMLWGGVALTGLSHLIARSQGTSSWRTILEHLLIAAIVILATRAVGEWVARVVH